MFISNIGCHVLGNLLKYLLLTISPFNNTNSNLSKDELCEIAVKIGADVPFFVYEYDSANVTGIGEIVEKFDEEIRATR